MWPVACQACTGDDAIKQARSELRVERAQEKVDALVDEGRITQEQADKYMEWVQADDETRRAMSLEAAREKFDALVDEGRMTQEQADEYIAWLESAPADHPGFFKRGHRGHKWGGKILGRGGDHHGWGFFR